MKEIDEFNARRFPFPFFFFFFLIISLLQKIMCNFVLTIEYYSFVAIGEV